MSESSYTVTCTQCKAKATLEIYTDGWFGISLDSSKVLCLDCEKKRNPQDWFVGQCIVCSEWVDQDKNVGPFPSVKTREGWLCQQCVKEGIEQIKKTDRAEGIGNAGG